MNRNPSIKGDRGVRSMHPSWKKGNNCGKCIEKRVWSYRSCKHVRSCQKRQDINNFIFFRWKLSDIHVYGIGYTG